jgi:16S rRNA (adenine1518-N6/adenine1519-N6)-dimethyltransferase
MATTGRRRAYGQHFLKDRGVCQKIAETTFELIAKNGSRSLLEIGPGKGAITNPLLDRFAAQPELNRFLICEKDRELAHGWKMDTATLGRIEIFDNDFLELDSKHWLSHAPLTVVSNLPYSSGTAIFTRLAREISHVRGMVLMFQAEVAHRLRAEQGTKDWGSLSIWTQNLWDVKKLLTVPPGAFVPPPQVMSEVVVFVPRAEPRIPGTVGEGEKAWEELLKACFAHRRKMLRSGLPKTGALRNALELSGVDDTKRAEALDWNEWEKLFRARRSS